MKTTLVSLVRFFQNPDTSSSDWNYRIPGRGTKNVKILHQCLFIGQDPSSGSVDDPSDLAPADMINIAALVLYFKTSWTDQQSADSPAVSIDTFSKEVQLFGVCLW